MKKAFATASPAVFFSVVIPLYNKESTVERAIRSVLAQTVQDFEIVVVDDGSTDASANIVRRFSDPRIRLVQQANAGVSAARNRGVAEARHDLIAFLDADDEWLPDFLSAISRMVRGFPEAGVYATRYYMQRNGKRWPAVLKGLPDQFEGVLRGYFAIARRSTPPICSSAVCIRRKALVNVGGFPTGIAAGEDLLTWARLACSVPIAYSNSPLAVFQQDASGIGEAPPSRTPQVPDRVGVALRQLYAENPNPDLRRYLGLWHKMRASCFLRLGMRRYALLDVFRSLRFAWNPKLLIYLLILPFPVRVPRALFRRLIRSA